MLFSQSFYPSVFILDIWLELQTFISDWVKKYNLINIMAGPVFDYNSDGLPDDMETLHILRYIVALFV